MARQKFKASIREAIWLAYGKKCGYTGELIDASDFHIDHLIPESLLSKPAEFQDLRKKLGLNDTFDICGFENLIPCKQHRNLQKGASVFNEGSLQYFLGIASAKKPFIIEHLNKIEKRETKSLAVIMLLQCRERGEITNEEIVHIFDNYSEKPSDIFKLIQTLKFGDEEVKDIIKVDIAGLREKSVRLGGNDHINSLTLTNDNDLKIEVHNCQEYDAAIEAGYYPFTTFDMKMATFFEHQCGLLKALEIASTPQISYISDPRAGIADLNLMPFSFFPYVGETLDPEEEISTFGATYQSMLDNGELFVKRLKQNLLVVEESDGMGQQIIEIVRADFNGDGIEDILLFEYCYATHGTLGYGGIKILTRKTPDGLFEIVDL